VANDGVDQEIPAGLGRIAAEGLGLRHLVDGFVHRPDHRVRQRAGHVADSEADQLRIGVRRLVLARAPAGLAEEIAGAKLQVVVVDPGHGARF
jgi:hypothetical protein